MLFKNLSLFISILIFNLNIQAAELNVEKIIYNDKIRSTLTKFIRLIDLCIGTKKCFDSIYYDFENQYGNLLFDNEAWNNVDLAQISKAISCKNIPLQDDIASIYYNLELFFNKENTNYAYKNSCGPISLALAQCILSDSDNDADWPKIIKSFPYFCLGVFPQKLVAHFNDIKDEDTASIKHIIKNDFESALDIIKNEIDNHKPVTILLVQSAVGQHYVNVIAYNDEEAKIALLDPSGKIKVRSYQWLADIMYAGIAKSYGITYFLLSILTTPVMKFYASYGAYNLFIYQDF